MNYYLRPLPFPVVFFGGVGIGMAFMAKNLGGTVLQVGISLMHIHNLHAHAYS